MGVMRVSRRAEAIDAEMMKMAEDCEVFNYSLHYEAALELLPDRFDTVAVLGLMPVILGLGVAFNLGFLAVLLRLPAMRSPTNLYLASLAVSDTAFLALAIGPKIGQHLTTDVSFPVAPGSDGGGRPAGSLAGCLIVHLLVNLTYFASLAAVTLVSVEKFLAVCRPVRHRVADGWLRAHRLSLAGWAVSLLVATAILPGYSRLLAVCIIWPAGEPFTELSATYWQCGAVVDWASSFSNVFQTVPFFGTLVLNTTLYALIVRRLSLRADNPLGRPVAVADRHRPQLRPFPCRPAVRARNRAAKMLVINGAVCFLLLAPFEVVSVLLQTKVLASWPTRRAVLQVCRLLSYLNAAVNPLIYGAVNARYRRAYWLFLRACARRPHRVDALRREPAAAATRERAPSTGNDGHI